MKKLFATLLVAVFTFTTGCSKKDETASGDKKLAVKAEDVTLKQGETKEIKLSLTRTKVEEPVTVTITEGDLPKGVSIETKPAEIAKDKNEGTFKLKAADDADVGEKSVTIKVKGGSTEGETKLKVKVEKK